MTARATGQRFRQRKLSTKQNLPVVRESEVEQLADDDASRHIPKVETGVEKGEEIVSRASPLLAFTSPALHNTHTYIISRNTIYRPSSPPPRQLRKARLVGRLHNSTFRLRMLSPAHCNMKMSIQNGLHNLPLTYGSRQPWRIRPAARIA
jgi:hypothetical protein